MAGVGIQGPRLQSLAALPLPHLASLIPTLHAHTISLLLHSDQPWHTEKLVLKIKLLDLTMYIISINIHNRTAYSLLKIYRKHNGIIPSVLLKMS